MTNMYEDKLENKTSKDFFFQICTLLSCKLENSAENSYGLQRSVR